jgi:cytochrome P450
MDIAKGEDLLARTPGEINFMDPEVQENWFSAYEVLQRDAPVYFMPEIGMYVLTKYEDVMSVVRQPEVFTGGPDFRKNDPMIKFAEARALYEQRGWRPQMPLNENLPKHRRYRGLIDPFFTPAAVKKREPMVRKIINDLIDRWIDKGEIEFMKEFAEPLPMTVIAEFLGFPRMDLPQLKEWSYAWVLPESRGLSLEQELWAVDKHIELQHYIHEAAKAKRAKPKDDIISHLVSAEYRDEETGETRPLRDEEIIGITDHLLIGGNETTTFALSNGLWLLFRFPEAYREIEADHGKIKSFVEEVLRLESPTQQTYRYVTRDVEIRGVKIPEGSLLALRLGAGNRDPGQFPDPSTFDLTRRNVGSHVAFSYGEHHCPGAALSRFEQNCAWDVILERMCNIRPAPGKNDFGHVRGIWLRALKAIHMQFDKVS